ncbi:MAG TPA: proton-conducting transporter membrane subunit, partial [Pyrinomonadaceae bacterium]|nr:proton-conducting transporter membrane subunit [Pyrinomonadaceae bacterium]
TNKPPPGYCACGHWCVVGGRAFGRLDIAARADARLHVISQSREPRPDAATTPEDRSTALSAVAFYLLTYAVMNMGAFAVVTLIARRGDQRTSVDDYNGIGFASPVLAFSLSLFLLSLLGMPLTAGFMGKIVVFSAALRQGYVWLIVIGVLNTAISAYYYLRLIIVMFFREQTSPWEAPRVPVSVAVALVITILGVFYLGLFPGRVISAFQSRPSITVKMR